MTLRASRRHVLSSAALALLAVPLAGCQRLLRWLASAGRARSPMPTMRFIHDSDGADGGFLRMSREGRGYLGTSTLGVEA